MSFDVTADAYGRFMGRFSEPLAIEFAAWSGVQSGMTALDVGCGPGALTARLVEVLGADSVCAVDPSPSFVAAARSRFPGMDIAEARAEALPLADNVVDVALAQLVVHFIKDPVAGLREMARVTRPGGTVAACTWDLGPAGRAPVSLLEQTARELGLGDAREMGLPGSVEGHLAELLTSAGLTDARSGEATVRVRFADFDDWWVPYTLGVGPAGVLVKGLDPVDRERLRVRCSELLPSGPFEITATAWCAAGRVAG